jgi:predicted lipid carrier protein YhbT
MTQQFSVLPEMISQALPLLPPTPHSVVLAFSLNRMLGECIPPEWLLPLQGKLVCIQVTDARLAFFLGANQRGFVARRFSQTPDLTIGASMRDFIQLALREVDADSLFFGRRLVMEGDTDLGLLIKNVLDSVDASQLPLVRWLPENLRARIRAGLVS